MHHLHGYTNIQMKAFVIYELLPSLFTLSTGQLTSYNIILCIKHLRLCTTCANIAPCTYMCINTHVRGFSVHGDRVGMSCGGWLTVYSVQQLH
jgi:hypothetical protein